MGKIDKGDKIMAKQNNGKGSGGFRLFLHRLFIGVVITAGVLSLMYGLLMTYAKPPDISVTPPPVVSDDDPDIIDPSEISERREDFYTFLVCGTDEGKTRTDTIMLVAYDTAQNKVSIMNIPRDTVANSKRKVKKINGGYNGDPENLKEEVTELTGVPIDRYAIIDFRGFEKVIDVIGGVEYDVPVRMKYTDSTQDLYIDLKPGLQTLNGKKALHFVRFRKGDPGTGGGYPEGDVGRIKAQQEFIKAVIKQVAHPKNMLEYGDIAQAIFDNTKTDMTASEILWFGMKAIKMGDDAMQMMMLPGYDQYMTDPDYGEPLSYYFGKEKEILEMVNLHFNPYLDPITKLSLKDISKFY